MIKMKQKLIIRTVFFSVLICFQFGCTINNKLKYQRYQDMKDLVLNEDRSRSGYFLFFLTDTKNEIAYREAYYLQSELNYSPKFKDVDIQLFFKDIMFGKIVLPCGDLVACFTLSPDIMDKYKQEGIDRFLQIYATYYEKDNSYVINSSLNHEETLSVAYYLYLNNIYTVYDGYELDYISRRVPLYKSAELDDDLEEIIE